MIVTNHGQNAVFRALADPVRREILESLADRPLTVRPLAEHFEISRPAVSRHLRVLLEAGLVERRAEGRTNVYAVREEALRMVEEWLRRFWRGRLERLRDLVREDKS